MTNFIEKLPSVAVIILACLSLVGCAQDIGGFETSTVRLQMPETFNKSAKAGEVQALGSSACFAVDLSGDGISQWSAGTCDPPKYGMFRGLIPAGGEISLEVTQGRDRVIDLYYVSSPEGCAALEKGKGIGHLGSDRVHRIGHLENVSMNKADVVVHLPIELPAVSNTLQAIHNFAASCKNSTPFLTVGSKDSRQVVGFGRAALGASGYTATVRVTDKKIDVSSNSSVRITPHRLGVTQ